jgi:hypothetical protein
VFVHPYVVVSVDDGVVAVVGFDVQAAEVVSA